MIALLILIISLKTTFVSLSKCENSTGKCIQLCCTIVQTYIEDFKACHDIPRHATPLWFSLMRNMSKTVEVSFIPNDECMLFPELSVIDNCFAPYYERYAAGIILKEYSNVPCERFPINSDLPKLYLRRILSLLSSLILPIFLFHTCTKKDKKDKLSYRLITWYLMSVTAAASTFGLYDLIEIHSKGFFGTPIIYMIFVSLSDFFWTSAHLWLSCIGYYVYVQFKEANLQSTNSKERTRFIWFSVYVWSGALTINIVFRMIGNYNLVIDGSIFLIAYLNIVAFLVLSLKICLIRCGVIGISTEKHIKCRLARVICRLCALMGIPRMLMVILIPVIGLYPLVIVQLLEPFSVFGTFIAENENCCTLISCKCCCCRSLSEENDNVTGTTTMRGTTTV